MKNYSWTSGNQRNLNGNLGGLLTGSLWTFAWPKPWTKTRLLWHHSLNVAFQTCRQPKFLVKTKFSATQFPLSHKKAQENGNILIKVTLNRLKEYFSLTFMLIHAVFGNYYCCFAWIFKKKKTFLMFLLKGNKKREKKISFFDRIKMLSQ